MRSNREKQSPSNIELTVGTNYWMSEYINGWENPDVARWEKQRCKYLAKLKNKMTEEVVSVNTSQSTEQ
jgi:hypothetical protein